MKFVMTDIAAIALAVLPAFAAHAQSYPSKPVRWIVPFPPGGGTDLVSRAITPKLTEAWNVQVVADNRPGSGGTIGLAAAAKSPPDGYTIVLGQTANVSVAPALYSKLPYDPQKDLIPVTQVIAAPLVIVSHPSFPARNAKELIALARAKPGSITFGSPGNGTMGHLSTEMLKTMARIDMLHVPYKGASLAITELMGGHIVIYPSSIPPAVSLIKAGKLRAIATTGATRVAALPDVATVAESALPGYEAINWYGVFVPAGTPSEIVAKLHADITRIIRQPDVRERFASEGGDAVGNTPEQFAAFVRAEIPKWAKVARDSGAKVD
jgi:tripartite-type tricarboxylate transporter receptor subunit TctC